MVRWLILAVFLTGCAVANAENPQCGDRELIIKQLKEIHKEELKFRGYSVQFKVMFEVFVGPSGSWTLLITSPNKPDTVCRADYGQGGDLPPVKKLGVRI